MAVVEALFGLEKLTEAGPETKDQARVSSSGSGRPSSVTLPLSRTWALPLLRKPVLSGPALTTGALLVAPPVLVFRTRDGEPRKASAKLTDAEPAYAALAEALSGRCAELLGMKALAAYADLLAR